MATVAIKQEKTISLDMTDWKALEVIAKAHKKSVNKYLEMLIKGAIAEEQELPIVQTQEEFERKILQIIKDMEEGKHVFEGTVSELRHRYECL